MTASISIWLKDILPRTPGVVRSVAARELILAAREFYRDSTYWRAVVESTYWDAGDYAFTVPSPDTGAEVLQVLSVEVNGQDLTSKVERPQGDRGTGTPTLWFPTGPDTIEVWPTPDMYEDAMRVRVILIPVVGATTLPDVALKKHYDALLDGVLGRLYAHPAKAYSNTDLGTYHLNRFRAAIATAAGEVKQGGFAGQNWRYPSFGK
jgi:hypothetical protein